MQIPKLSSLKLGANVKKFQFKFVKFLVKYPLLVVFVSVIISSILSFCGLYLSPMSGLSIPTKELSTIGTPLSARRNVKDKLDRMIQNKELYKIDDLIKKFNLSQSDILLTMSKSGRSLNHYAVVSAKSEEKHIGDYSDETDFSEDMIQKIAREIGSSFVENQKFRRQVDDYESENERLNFNDDELNKPDSEIFEKSKSTYISCNSVLNDECSQMIIESQEPSAHSLLSFEAVNIQCNFIEQYLKPYLNNGILKTNTLNNDIQVESISSIITKFSNKDTCNELDRIDVGNFTLIFKYCSLIYKKLANYSLMDYPTLEQAEQLKLSPLCTNQNLIDSYNYLIDKNLFIQNDEEIELSEIFDIDPWDLEVVEPPQVRYTSIYMSVNKRDKHFLSQFYENFLKPHFLNKPLEINDNVSKFQIIALNFEIKNSLFQKSLVQSLNFLISSFAISSVLLIILSKSPSVLVGFLICVSFGFLDSYFFYKILLNIEFFSFFNLLAIFFLTCFTATNIFLFTDTWTMSKVKNKFILYKYRQESSKNETLDEDIYQNHPYFENYLENCVFYTYKNVLWPLLISLAIILTGILVLILTSSIVLVKIYAIFLAISIFFNFFLTILIIPAILIIKQKSIILNKINIDHKHVKNLILNVRNLTNHLKFIHDKIFELYLPTFIVFYRYILIIISVAIGITSFIVVGYKPGLQVTNLSQFRLFSGKNPIEFYESSLSFLSDSNGIFTYQSEIKKNLPISYVFGVEIKDQSSFMYNLDELLELQTGAYDFYDEKSQLWFDRFCESLNNSLLNDDELNTYEKTSATIERLIYLDRNENKNICFYDLMRVVFSRKCIESNEMAESYCCDMEFPFDSDVFEECLKNKYFLDNYVSPYENILAEKLYFNKANGLLDIIEYDHTSKHEWTSNYNKISQIYSEIKTFFDSILKLKFVDLVDGAQENKSLNKYAFFVSNFDFYDFQRSILISCLITVLLTILILTLILLIITRHLFITLIAVLTIVMSLSTTIGILVLFELKLNITNLVSLVSSIFLSTNSLVYLSISYSSLLSSSQETYQEFTTMFFVCENTIESLLKRFGSSIFKPSLLIILSLILVLPCEIYSFQSSAIFYMLANFFSLFFTFFLFLPLCTISPAFSYCCDFKRDNDFSNFQMNKDKNENSVNKIEIKHSNSNNVFTTSI